MPYIYLLVPLSLFFIFYITVQSIGKTRSRSSNRITKYIKHKEKTAYDLEMNRSLSERVILPVYRKLSNAISRMVPRNRLDTLTLKLDRGGLKISPQEFLTVHLLVMAVIPSLTASILYWSDYNTGDIVMIFILLAAAGYLLPKYWLSSKVSKRKRRVRRELPGLIDLLTVSMEAGLSFDMALAKIISKSRGFLIEELDLALNKIRRGVPRRDALKEMAQKMDVDELTNFIGTILQAEKLGISISNILRVQAGQMREVKKQWAKEKGGKAAVKIILPLVIFILPVIFIILLGPSIMNLNEVFK
ncbi:MAG: hypothetical protein HPY66_2216 [Firmicutes bacterium]|nr:hypothetical protein [Bacillota bacterium]MDI6705612.1 type II secretion system F family protein [Bacillota bacterium]